MCGLVHEASLLNLHLIFFHLDFVNVSSSKSTFSESCIVSSIKICSGSSLTALIPSKHCTT